MRNPDFSAHNTYYVYRIDRFLWAGKESGQKETRDLLLRSLRVANNDCSLRKGRTF